MFDNKPVELVRGTLGSIGGVGMEVRWFAGRATSLLRANMVSPVKKWIGNFHDILSNKKANDTFAEFVRNKIRARVKDPKVAEKLIPRIIRSAPIRAALWAKHY